MYRSKQLPLTYFLEAVLVGTLLGMIYIHAGYGEAGAHKRLGLFAFTLTFLLTSTTETLSTFVTERPIVLAETAAGLYRLSSHVGGGHAGVPAVPSRCGAALLRVRLLPRGALLVSGRLRGVHPGGVGSGGEPVLE